MIWLPNILFTIYSNHVIWRNCKLHKLCRQYNFKKLNLEMFQLSDLNNAEKQFIYKAAQFWGNIEFKSRSIKFWHKKLCMFYRCNNGSALFSSIVYTGSCDSTRKYHRPPIDCSVLRDRQLSSWQMARNVYTHTSWGYSPRIWHGARITDVYL
jgi:hypothetical protein